MFQGFGVDDSNPSRIILCVMDDQIKYTSTLVASLGLRIRGLSPRPLNGRSAGLEGR
jgi:hypothetical protein